MKLMTNICCKIDPQKPLTEYICEPNHREYAIKCANLLTNFKKKLRAYEARCHGKKPYQYTCWYVSFKHIREEKIAFILHFEIRRSDIYICFRFLDYAPQDVLTRGKWWIRDKSRYLHFKDYEGNESRLIEMIKEYLKRIKPHYDKLECRKRSPCG